MIGPAVLDSSTPPNVRRPLESSDDAGANEIPRTSWSMRPCAYALSSTVGTSEPSETVPAVRFVGPMLRKTDRTQQ